MRSSNFQNSSKPQTNSISKTLVVRRESYFSSDSGYPLLSAHHSHQLRSSPKVLTKGPLNRCPLHSGLWGLGCQRRMVSQANTTYAPSYPFISSITLSNRSYSSLHSLFLLSVPERTVHRCCASPDRTHAPGQPAVGNGHARRISTFQTSRNTHGVLLRAVLTNWGRHLGLFRVESGTSNLCSHLS